MMSLLRIAVILGLSAAAGAAYMRLFKPNERWIPDPNDITLNEQKKQKAAIELEAFRKLYEQGALVIDARTPDEYAKGHLDAPLIVNIPEDAVHEYLRALEAFRGTPFVIYCKSLECDAAEVVYGVLETFGFGEMHIFYPGWTGLQEAGLPTISGSRSTFDEMPGQPGDAQGGADEGGQPPGMVVP